MFQGQNLREAFARQLWRSWTTWTFRDRARPWSRAVWSKITFFFCDVVWTQRGEMKEKKTHFVYLNIFPDTARSTDCGLRLTGNGVFTALQGWPLCHLLCALAGCLCCLSCTSLFTSTIRLSDKVNRSLMSKKKREKRHTKPHAYSAPLKSLSLWACLNVLHNPAPCPVGNSSSIPRHQFHWSINRSAAVTKSCQSRCCLRWSYHKGIFELVRFAGSLSVKENRRDLRVGEVVGHPLGDQPLKSLPSRASNLLNAFHQALGEYHSFP